MYIHSFSYSWLASGIMGLRNICALYMKKYVFFAYSHIFFYVYMQCWRAQCSESSFFVWGLWCVVFACVWKVVCHLCLYEDCTVIFVCMRTVLSPLFVYVISSQVKAKANYWCVGFACVRTEVCYLCLLEDCNVSPLFVSVCCILTRKGIGLSQIFFVSLC